MRPAGGLKRKKWQDWVLSGDHSLTVGGCVQKASLYDACRGIKEAYSMTPQRSW